MAAAAAQAFGSLGGMFFNIQAAKSELKGKNVEASTILYDGVDASKFHLEQTKDLIIDQKLAFLKSGVTLEGSPLLVMEDTLRQGREDAVKIVKHAAQQAQVVMAGGRARVGAQVGGAIARGVQGVGQAYAGAQNRDLAKKGG